MREYLKFNGVTYRRVAVTTKPKLAYWDAETFVKQDRDGRIWFRAGADSAAQKIGGWDFDACVTHVLTTIRKQTRSSSDPRGSINRGDMPTLYYGDVADNKPIRLASYVKLEEVVWAYRFIDEHLAALLEQRDNNWPGEEQWERAVAAFRVDGYADSLKLLDQYLTGHTDARSKDRDIKQIRDLLLFESHDPIIYLSDGGYSRLKLPEEAGQNLTLVRGGISTPRVTEKWDALTHMLARDRPYNLRVIRDQ